MIYTDQEHEWLSKPAKKKRRSNQTADGQPPREDTRLYTRAWGIKNNNRSGRQDLRGAGTTVMEYTERHVI